MGPRHTVRRATPLLTSLAMAGALLAIQTTSPGQVADGPADGGPVVETFGRRNPLPPPVAKPRVLMPSERAGLALENLPQVRLGPVDTDALLAEDEFNGQFNRVGRIAVERDVLVRLRDGAWHDVPGGRVWAADVSADGAFGVRLYFIGMDLPPGGEVVVYRPGAPEQMWGPFTGRGRLGDGEFWTGTIFGDTARVEYFQPDAPRAKARPAVPFVISELSHMYRDLLRGGEGGPAGAGPCHNDVACFPEWADVADATGLISYPGGSCTGQLMETTSGDLTPYFSTANHCVSTSAEAAGAEIFWFYQHTTCNGAIGFVPSSLACSLVDTGSAADWTLLMVEGELPAGVFWSGWTNISVSNGVPVTCVHHPAGDFKRISFGQKASAIGACSFDNTNFMRSNWTDGVTEPGSSGSGLYLNSSQQLIATLTCGFSNCDNPGGDEDYGRFSRAYTFIASDLSSGSDDDLEQNDTCAEAVELTESGTWLARIVKSLDEDWYAVNLQPGGSVQMNVTFIDSQGDIDLQLYDACGGSVVAQSISNTNNESITFFNSGGSAQTYSARVYLDGTDTRANYNMFVTIDNPSGPLNDDCASAAVVGEGSTAFTTVGATTDGPDEAGMCDFNGQTQVDKDIWYKFVAPCGGPITVSLCGADYDSKLAIYLGGCPIADNTAIACNDDACGTASELTFNAAMSTQYRIRVGGTAGDEGSGTMEITCGGPDPCPADTDGNGQVDVDDLTAVILDWGTDGSGNGGDVDGSGLVDVDDLTLIILGWGPCP